MSNYRALSAGLILGLILGLPVTSPAKDTDIYLTAQGITRDDAPNVLIILDNSGSMDTQISAPQRLPYDPSIDYSAQSGSPGFTSGRIYWSTSGSPPTSGTSQWISASNNNCEASKTNLNTGGSGVYGSVKIIAFKPSGSGKGWRSISAGNDWVIDCQADNGATDPNGYPKNSSLTPFAAYTTNSSQEVNWNGFTGSSYTPTLYNANYMNYIRNTDNTNTNVWIPGQTRWTVAQSAVKGIIDANPSVRMGLMVFNTNGSSGPNGGRVVFRVDTMTDARRTAMKHVIDSLAPSTNTPLAETMWEAYRYLGGLGIDFGDDNPTLTVSSLTRSGSTVTVTTSSSHGFSTGDYVLISGANQAEYNGGFVVTTISSTQFSYTVSGTPTTPATGTIKTTLYRDVSAESGGNYISPFQYRCQQAYVIYVTDGDPTNDTSADSKIGGLPGIGTLSGSRLDELAGWMYNNDIYSGLLGTQRVVTYTVGFGGSISASGLQLLQDTATKGHGKYYTADDADQLTAALQGALIDILTVTTSFSAPALSVNAFNTLFNRDEVYLALFKPSGSKRWNGNVKKYTLCKGTETSPTCTVGSLIDRNGNEAVDSITHRIIDTASSYWGTVTDGNSIDAGGAGAKMPNPTDPPSASDRQVYTYTGGYDATDGRTPTGQTDLSNAANLVVDSNASLTAAMLNAADATERSKIIKYIRGTDSYDDDADTNVTENRPWRFGDPMHSRPLIVNYGGTSAAPIMKILVGTNDGALHMINESNGIEEWAFFPKELLGVQKDNGDNNEGDHIYGLDGTPTVLIRDRSGTVGNVVDVPDGVIDPAIGDYVHIFIGMRRGGNNIYAFDITPTTKLTDPAALGGVKPKLLWVIRGGVTPGFTNLAQTWSKPSVTQIRYGTATAGNSAPKTVLAFGGGYDTLNDGATPAPSASGNAIYLVDPDTGERLWWASGTGSGADLELAGMNFSIPSDLTLMDSNGDGSTDRIYVGDLGGQIWRIDLSPTLKKNTNAGSSGYMFADLGCPTGTRSACTGTTIQDRRKFYYPPDVAQVYDDTYEDAAEAKHDLVTIASGDREDPLDLITRDMTPTQEQVHNRIYVLRDYVISALTTGGTLTYPSTPIKDGDLYDATSDALQDPNASKTAIRAAKGWYINLQESTSPTWRGEKSLARTSIFGGILFVSTFEPSSSATATSTCAADEGIARQYALNILNGTPAFDYDGNGTYTAADRYVQLGGGLLPETVIIFRPGNAGGTTALTGPSTTQVPGGPEWNKTFWFQK